MSYRSSARALMVIVLLAACSSDSTEPVNESPTITITAPSTGTSVGAGESITFTATASDPEDGDLSSSVAWSSDVDGSIGTGASVSSTLSEGAHTVQASVSDADGATAQATVSVTVESNRSPTVSITGPSSDTTVTVGESVTFTATATDPEDGDLSTGVAWSSDIDGSLGSGASVAATLSLGVHTIEASVTDGDGSTSQATVGVTVEEAAPAQVTDLTVVAVTDSSVTLTWTEVLDGTGNPAEYEVRFAETPIGAGTGDVAASGSCAGIVSGTSVGATAQCEVRGLEFGKGYDLVVTSSRPNGGSRVFGAPSDPATGYTDFHEDFSAFADDAVPTAPHDGYVYTTRDGFNDVTVRVAASSGGLTDRPLVLAKAGSVLAGSPNFYIERPGLAPLVDAETGLIHLAMDVQVNSGSFCQFLVIRNSSGTPVSVSLHNLTYTVGVPFHMIMTIDVDAGTMSATQDGADVTVSQTYFPWMPVRFGLEGCTLSAQEEAIDNITIEWRNP